MANVFANTGKAIVTAALAAYASVPKYIGWGTGAGTAAATDTTLFIETGTRTTGTPAQVTTTTTNDTFQVTGTVTAGGAITVTNSGVFDASISGNLFQKGDFTGVALNNGDAIAFTFKTVFA